jgi:hypothetical protein
MPKGRLVRDGAIDFYVQEVTDRKDRKAKRRRFLVTRETMVRSRQPTYTIVVVDKKTGDTYVSVKGAVGQEAINAVDQVYPNLHINRTMVQAYPEAVLQSEDIMSIPYKVARLIAEDPDLISEGLHEKQLEVDELQDELLGNMLYHVIFTASLEHEPGESPSIGQDTPPDPGSHDFQILSIDKVDAYDENGEVPQQLTAELKKDITQALYNNISDEDLTECYFDEEIEGDYYPEGPEYEPDV